MICRRAGCRLGNARRTTGFLSDEDYLIKVGLTAPTTVNFAPTLFWSSQGFSGDDLLPKSAMRWNLREDVLRDLPFFRSPAE